MTEPNRKLHQAGRPGMGSLDQEIADAVASAHDCCAKCQFFHTAKFRDTGHLLCRRYPETAKIGVSDWCGEFAMLAKPVTTGPTFLQRTADQPVNDAVMGQPIPIAGPLGNIADTVEDCPPLFFECVYTNWRGETAVRRLLPRRIYWGSNQWHREPQYLVDCYDDMVGEIRSFALKDMVPKAIADRHDKRVTELLEANNREVARRREAEAVTIVARPLDEWHEDMHDVLWVKFPIEEAPHVGTPFDSAWPGYHTHFIPLPDCNRIVPPSDGAS